MPEKVKEKLARLVTAVKKIVEKAEEDGVITEDEAKIIEVATKGLKEFALVVDKALEDGIIDQDERNTLIDLEEQLMSNSYYQALEDNKLEMDELLLLKTLFLSIDPKSTVSWLEEDL